MNRHDFDDLKITPSRDELIQRWQSTIATVVILLIIYYGWPYLAYETTVKRRLFELAQSVVPTRLLRSVKQRVSWTGGFLDPNHFSHLPKENQRKSPLNQIYEGTGVSSVVQRARSISGYDKLLPPTTEITYPGLRNWDNSCFQNSVLQGLSSLHYFQQFVGESVHAYSDKDIDYTTSQALETFISQMHEEVPSMKTISPPPVLRTMNTWHQQDAQEYFSKVMDGIEKEAIRHSKQMLRAQVVGLGRLWKDSTTLLDKGNTDGHPYDVEHVHATRNPSPSNPLDGFLSQSLRCQTCKYSEGLSLISFNCLTLNLGLGGNCHLEDLLDTYTDLELIEGVECDECTRLARQDVHTSHTGINESQSNDVEVLPSESLPAGRQTKIFSTKAKQILFARLPRNLVFHINRSIFDDWGNQRKNTALVQFPPRLEIGSEWMESSISEGSSHASALYELRCIVTHHGRHDNGHYVACGKRGKFWYSFNDEIVTKITEEQVLARGNVFMLFYEQIENRSIIETTTLGGDISEAANTPESEEIQPEGVLS